MSISSTANDIIKDGKFTLYAVGTPKNQIDVTLNDLVMKIKIKTQL